MAEGASFCPSFLPLGADAGVCRLQVKVVLLRRRGVNCGEDLGAQKTSWVLSNTALRGALKPADVISGSLFTYNYPTFVRAVKARRDSLWRSPADSRHASL